MSSFLADGRDGTLLSMGDFTTRTRSRVNPFGMQMKYLDHILRHGLEELFLLQYFKFQNHTTFFYKIHVLRHAADWSLHFSLVALPAAAALEPSSNAG